MCNKANRKSECLLQKQKKGVRESKNSENQLGACDPAMSSTSTLKGKHYKYNVQGCDGRLQAKEI